MKFSRLQTIGIVVLNILIVGLISAVVWISISVGGDTPTVVPPITDPIFERYRAAVGGGVEGVEWENAIYGSGEESVAGVFRRGEDLYVFGGTTSNDGDFDYAGGYAVKLTGGKIEKYTYFKGAVVSVTLFGDAFAVAADKLYAVDLDLNAREVASPENVVTLKLGIGTLLCVCRTESVIKISSYIIYEYDKNFVVLYTTNIASAYSLEMLDLYTGSNEYILAVNRTSSIGTHPAFISFYRGSPKTCALNTVNGAAMFITPYKGGFMCLINLGSGTQLIRADYTYAWSVVATLDINAVSATCVYEDGKYYVLIDGGGANVLYEYSADFSEARTISIGSVFSSLYKAEQVNGGLVLMGTSKTEVIIASESGVISRVKAANAKLGFYADGVAVFTSTGGDFVHQNQGTDTHIVKFI